MHIAIIGAGINGLCTGWELARVGHRVTIFERDRILSHTSSASSKLLHGGLRYLENGEFRLVWEALREREAWFKRTPDLAKPIRFSLPIYGWSRRGRWYTDFGLRVYDRLAKSVTTRKHRWLDCESAVALHPSLKCEDLRGAFQFWDGQMDESRLGHWVAERAREAGVVIHERSRVDTVSTSGILVISGFRQQRFDHIVNASGPWASHLLRKSKIAFQHELDLIRGSHIILARPCDTAYLLEAPKERRIFFVLPWKGGTLIGTTEQREEHSSDTEPKPPEPSNQEIDYLLRAYNHYFIVPAAPGDVREAFSGLRPLVKSFKDPNKATREYVLERQDKLTTIFGGKWTTACALARKVRHQLEHP